MLPEADPTHAAPEFEKSERRLSALIARAYFQAYRNGDMATAGHLLSALQCLTEREQALYPRDRRQAAGPLDGVQAHFTLATTDITQRSAEHGYVM